MTFVSDWATVPNTLNKTADRLSGFRDTAAEQIPHLGRKAHSGRIRKVLAGFGSG